MLHFTVYIFKSSLHLQEDQKEVEYARETDTAFTETKVNLKILFWFFVLKTIFPVAKSL